MNKTNFLTKIIEEGKLELVEPSEEVKQAYLNKSESNIISAKILIKNERLEESVSLAYYSMYNLLIALLFKTGIKSENHSASIIILKEIFGLDNSDILFAKKERVDKQYYVDFTITKEEVEKMIRKAEIFNKKLFDFIARLTNEKVEVYRYRFKKLMRI